MPNKKQLVILIDPPKLDRLKAAAAAIDRSMVWLVNDLIDGYLSIGSNKPITDVAILQTVMEEIAAMGQRMEAIEQRVKELTANSDQEGDRAASEGTDSQLGSRRRSPT
jgi:hypothetical protein